MDNGEHPDVELTCHCESVDLDLDTVTAIALVISELLQISYAHAFPEGKGLISVALSAGQSGEDATVVFADNGVGSPEPDPDGNNLHGLGFVNRLMERLGGSATRQTGNGTECTLKFPVAVIPSAGRVTPPGSDTASAAGGVHLASGSTSSSVASLANC